MKTDWQTDLIALGLLLSASTDRRTGFTGLSLEDRSRDAGTTRTVAKGDVSTALASGRASVCITGHGVVGGGRARDASTRRSTKKLPCSVTMAPNPGLDCRESEAKVSSFRQRPEVKSCRCNSQ